MSGRFPVKVDDKWREAEIRFATESEVKRLAFWWVPQSLPADARVVRNIFDSVEFARLASNRWRYYHREGSAVKSMAHLEETINANHQKESAMVLIARPAWVSSTKTLGIAYLRRTWCHHFYLEFFAAHPHVLARRYERIQGVGDAMLNQIVALAEKLAIPCIWGEATVNSYSWYQDHLAIIEVRDHFFIEDDVMRHCQKEMHNAQKEMLARRATT